MKRRAAFLGKYGCFQLVFQLTDIMKCNICLFCEHVQGTLYFSGNTVSTTVLAKGWFIVLKIFLLDLGF